MEKQHHINAKELFQRFLQGNLNKAEEALLRKEAESDPFLADAIAGIDQGGAQDHSANLTEIRKQLSLSIEKEERKIVPWKLISGVAAIGLLLIIGSQLWQSNLQNPSMSKQMETAAPKVEPPLNENNDEKTSVQFSMEPEEESLEIKKDKSTTNFNYQTGANEVKQNTDSRKKVVVQDQKIIENEASTTIKTNPTPSPPPAVEKDITFSDDSEFPVAEIAEEEPEAFVESTSSDFRADANEAVKKRGKAKQESNTQVQQDSSYYTESGVLVETVFDANDSNFIYTGSVFDEEGAPLIGANVLVEGTKFGTTTDLNGGFVVSSPKRLPTLEVFYTGFEPSKIRPIRTDDNLSIFLAENMTLDEVVITSAPRTSRAERMDKTQQASIPTPIATSYKPKGGYPKWNKYLSKNLVKPQDAKSNGISGTVTLSFSILEKGEIIKIEVLNSVGYGCDEEAIRLLKEGPKWISKHKNVETIGLVNIEF